ncbi:DUF1674 domain-containing protein [uncultured Enterovirga sp.]|uniref:DUF1674 domain-containing protein n=1 Tax=uncultured Enterovirga sp. TaxID=2026352 RepID=UPI0035C9EBDB
MHDAPNAPPVTAPVAAGDPDADLPPAARRALAEAEARRADVDARAATESAPAEHQGRGGLDPVRYADWEIGGRAVDF